MKKKNVAFVISELSFFKSHRLDLCEELSKEFNVYVITDLNDSDFKYNGIEFLNLRKRSSKGFLLSSISFLRYLFDLNRLLKKRNFATIFFVTLELSIAGCITSINTNKKIINVISGTETLFSKKNTFNQLKKTTIKFVFKLSNLLGRQEFVFQNKHDYLDFKNKLGFRGKLRLISGNGINVEKIPYKERTKTNRIKILLASKLLKNKGIYAYIRAINLYKDQFNQNCDFFLAGEMDYGHPNSISRDCYSDILNNSHVTYLGELSQEEYRDILVEYEILVLPSLREGLPLSLVEGMLSGMPIITTDVPGCSDCVHNYVNGILVPHGDDQALADAFNFFDKNKEKIEAYGSQSRLIAINNFSLAPIANQYKKIIHE